MKNSGKGNFLVVIAFLAISLLAANAFILNSDFKGGFEPRFLGSILNKSQNENTQTSDKEIKITVDGKENMKNANEDGKNEREILDGTDRDDNRVNEKDSDSAAAYESAVRSGASGKVLIEQSSKRVLLGQNERAKCYPASTTKILTAYVTLMNLPLDHVVTVPKQAAGVEGSSLYLKAGAQITVEDLIFGLMLRSGNDAATALAIEVAGSVEAFAEIMNDTARKLGANDSHFVNPHGLHDDDHYTTAYDLALITAAAYELDDFKRIVGTKVKNIAVDGEVCAIANKNKLLKLFDGANGVKTGYTKKSGRCLAGGAERDGMQLISVVFNCPDMWNDTAALLDYGFENFEMVPLDNALLTYGEGKKKVEISAKYNVTSDWRDMYYPLAKDEYLVVNAA